MGVKPRILAGVLVAATFAGALYGFASTRRAAKYERELQHPSPADPDDAWLDAEFAFTRLRYRSNRDRRGYMSWGIDSNTAERHFMEGIRRLTRIDARSVEQIVDIDDDEMFDWPWLYAVSAGDWVLSDSQAARLRQYLDRGGFLVVDDFHGDPEWDQFLEGVRQIYPEAIPIELEDQAEIFHTVFDLSERVQVPGYQIVERGSMMERNNGYVPHWFAVLDDKNRVRISGFLNQDLGDAWEFSNDPAYPEHFASQAYRMGVNYVVYSMTH